MRCNPRNIPRKHPFSDPGTTSGGMAEANLLSLYLVDYKVTYFLRRVYSRAQFSLVLEDSSLKFPECDSRSPSSVYSVRSRLLTESLTSTWFAALQNIVFATLPSDIRIACLAL